MMLLISLRLPPPRPRKRRRNRNRQLHSEVTMPEQIDFSPIIRAKIPAAHFARLCGANRVSAFKWLRGTNPRGLYRERVIHRLKLVQRAIDRGNLPLPPMSRTMQFAALVAALKS
jgi:hypothetical protein